MSETVDFAVGIDLGTTFSVVAHLDNESRPWTVTNAEGDLTTPSAVFFDKSTVIVGKEAMKAAEFEPNRVAQFAKLNMGEREYERKICDHCFPPEVIQALVLKKLKEDAERKLGPFRRAVITVPAYFNEPRRKATQDAGALAGIDVLDIINEPTAAAIAYGVQQGFLSRQGESERRETILVYDLGGGTFDVTVMEIVGQNYTAVATAGDVYLGGVDWDLRIVDLVAEQFLSKFGLDPRQDEHARQALMAEANDAKHALTVREEVNIPFSHEGNRLRVPLSRSEFEELSGDLLDRTELTVRKVLHEANREWSDLTRVLLVGGSTRMPMVGRMLEDASGLPTDRSLSPDEAVAHGAAIYAGLLLSQGDIPQRGMSVANVNSHDLGVLGIDPETGTRRRKVLIPRNTTLPAAGARKFITHRAGQANVQVTVVEGGDAAGNNATVIGKCVVTDLPTDLPARSPIKVGFNYSSNGRLTVGASLPGTGRQAKITIQRSSGLSAEVIQQWRERIESGDLFSSSGQQDDEPLATIETADILPDDVEEQQDSDIVVSDEPPEEAPEPQRIPPLGRPGKTRPAAADSELNDFLKGLGN